jgi:hypothetical protein
MLNLDAAANFWRAASEIATISVYRAGYTKLMGKQLLRLGFEDWLILDIRGPCVASPSKERSG